MAIQKLTDETVAKTRAPASGRLELWDEELPGFGLRITHQGRKSWQVMYRVKGRKRRLTLGRYPALPLEVAREAAREALQTVARGDDPAAERASLTGGALTFESFAKAYIQRYAKRKKRSWAADARMIEGDLLPAWRRRPADAITRRDVIELIEQVHQRGHPYAANRRLALIRKMYAWGVEVDMVPSTPVIAIKPPAEEAGRDRVLSDRELASLWRAWGQMAWPFGPLFKLLLVTAQRRSLVAGLRLGDIGLADQIWMPPPSAAGAAAPNPVPLSSFAIEILTSLPRQNSPYVFPSRGHPERPVSGFSKAARRAADLSGIADWRIEDLRRTATAGMLSLEVPPHILDRVLNRGTPIRHDPGAGRRQDRGIEEMRRALTAWAERLQEIIEPRGPELLPRAPSEKTIP
jgi:integrase